MASAILYTACLAGAVALYLLLRPAPRPVKGVAALIGLAALAWVAKELARAAPGEAGPSVFFSIFGLIAIVCAVRMITHRRPVYSALYFVMVVLSSAGLFLLLEAEFMAFALVIVYAGAILITYLFVLMLAEQAPLAGQEDMQADYDLIPREPAAAVVVGFVLLAVLSDLVVEGTAQLDPPDEAAMRERAWEQLELMPDRIAAVVEADVPDFLEIVRGRDGRYLQLGDGEAYALVEVDDVISPLRFHLDDTALPDNIEHVGLALVGKFPASLELAGVILLMAMFGAVVLAQRQIQLTEQEKKAVASSDRGPDEGGASP